MRSEKTFLRPACHPAWTWMAWHASLPYRLQRRRIAPRTRLSPWCKPDLREWRAYPCSDRAAGGSVTRKFHNLRCILGRAGAGCRGRASGRSAIVMRAVHA
eukprot:scaffold11342_cov114-Isochrysis_galbana.AAC.15